MADPRPWSRHFVELDIPITRRMTLHSVSLPNGDQVFHSKRIAEVFTWLLENEIIRFTMLDSDVEFRVSIQGPLPPNPQSKG